MAVYNGKEISDDKLKEKIVNVKGNRFIYGYDNGNRTEFLKSIEEANLITEKDTPIVIYSDSWGLPPIDSEIEERDSAVSSLLHRYYLISHIEGKILEKAMNLSMDVLNKKLAGLIEEVSRYPRLKEVKTIEDLLRVVKDLNVGCIENYTEFGEGRPNRNFDDRINSTQFSILQRLEQFLTCYRSCMQMKSKFIFLFDKTSEVSFRSTKMINSLFYGSLFSSNGYKTPEGLFVNVGVEPGNWATNESYGGTLIEDHDYTPVDLDGSYKAYCKKLGTWYYDTWLGE